jgi:hypothetical protein
VAPGSVRAQDYSVREVYELRERVSAQPQYQPQFFVPQTRFPLTTLCPNGQCWGGPSGTIFLEPSRGQPFMQRGPTFLDLSRTRVVYRSRH